MRWAVIAVALFMPLSGCTDGDAAAGDTEVLPELWSYPTGITGDEEIRTLTFNGTMLPGDEQADDDHHYDIGSLFHPGERLHLSVKLTWQAQPQGNEDVTLDLCVPEFCGDTGFDTGSPSPITLQVGTHHDPDWDAYEVAILQDLDSATSQIEYRIHVEAIAVDQVLERGTPYEVIIPEDGTLYAELVTPFTDIRTFVGMYFFDDQDNLILHHEAIGFHGDITPVPLPPGDYVVVSRSMDDRNIRLHADTPLSKDPLHTLDVETTRVELAAYDDAVASDELEWDIPGGSFQLDLLYVQSPGASCCSANNPPDAFGPVYRMDVSSDQGLYLRWEEYGVSFSSDDGCEDGGTDQQTRGCDSTYRSRGDTLRAEPNLLDDDGIYRVTIETEFGMTVYGDATHYVRPPGGWL